MKADKLPKDIRIHTEWRLRQYADNKALVDEYLGKREEIMHRGTSPDGMPRGSDVGRPTEAKGLKLALMDAKAQREQFWVEAIDAVLANLSEKEREIVELKYFQCWLTTEGIAIKLNMDRSTLYDYLDRILDRFARRMGLF